MGSESTEERGKRMRKTKFLGKVLSLALAVTLIAGMVPEMRAKAAETSGIPGWIKVTSENKGSLDDNVTDLSGWTAESIKTLAGNVRYVYNMEESDTNYYIIGKQGAGYYCINGKDQISSEGLSDGDYYFYPKYTVTLNLNGGTMELGNTGTTVAGLLPVLPTPTKEGYLFAGWYTTSQGMEEVNKYTAYNASTTIYAHWYQWSESEKYSYVRATTLGELESANLPAFGESTSAFYDFIIEYIKDHPLPEDADGIIYGRFCKSGKVNYWTYWKKDNEYHTGCFNSMDDLERFLDTYNYYVVKDPNAIVPATPTPEPVTPTPAPSVGDSSSSDSSDSGSSAPEPVLTTTNIAGEQITGWDAITKVISTQTKDKQQNVSGANQDLLHVDASVFDKTIPATTVKAVSTSALRGLHVFIGNSDAVTFLAKSKLSGYKETNFEHKDTVTDHSRTIDFTNKQALGTTVVFHTTVPVKNGEVTVYKVDASGRTRILKTVSNSNGQICFPITETATYVLEY